MYRFLLTPRWLAGAALAVLASLVMVLLGNWQLSRYHQRSEINARIDAAEVTAPVAVATVLTRPTAAGRAGPAPAKATAWTPVTATGRYDPTNEILVRGRTVAGRVGFEIVTPLLLADGSALLVDRGWVPPAEGGAIAIPVVPPAPTGTVTVVGQVHLTESRPSAVGRRDGRIDTRRVAVPRLAGQLPYPVYGAYVLLTEQTPAADPLFVPIEIGRENAWLNAGYTVQWWLFSAMALFAFGWQARREAHGDTGGPAGQGDPDRPDPGTSEPTGNDRVDAADQAAATAAGGGPAVPSARRPS